VDFFSAVQRRGRGHRAGLRSPAITRPLISRLVFKERFSPVKIISIALTLFGTILVSGAYDPSAWRLNAAGILFGLLTGLFFALYNLEGKIASDRSIDSWTALLYSFTAAMFFLFLYNLAFDAASGKRLLGDMLWLGNSVSGWGLLIFLGIVPTLMGFGLYTMSLRYLQPTVANLIATLEPVLTAIWAYFLLNEMLTGMQLLGGIFVFCGVMLLRLREPLKWNPWCIG
jgi:drug/metabolite transporter (DMT)-like permease